MTVQEMILRHFTGAVEMNLRNDPIIYRVQAYKV